MFKQFENSIGSNTDFNVVQYGYRDCTPGFLVHHNRCQNYLFHYVYEGRGTYSVNNTTYQVEKNQGFLSLPGQEISYTADKETPFSYGWVEFYGNMAFETVKKAKLDADNPIFTDKEPFQCGALLKFIIESGKFEHYRLTGYFWLFANELVKGAQIKVNNLEVLFQRALDYIHSNIDRPTTVESVAKNIGVTRGYLTIIFSKFIDLSPKQYIIRYHMNEAKSLLAGTDMSLDEIACATGFENGNLFSKAFVRLLGISPTEYRKRCKGKQEV